MYNALMPISSYEIRVCNSCGLRYPFVEGHPFGTRCPVCLGETHLVLSRELVTEPSPIRPAWTETSSSRIGFEEGKGRRFAVLLDNIRSAWNVGSILRSADGFGFTQAYLCGITPTPDGPSRETVAKTSLGAEYSVPWSYHKDAVRLVKVLKVEGWKVYALEDDDRAVSLESNGLPLKVQEPAPALHILIVGNEVTGVDPELLDLCDEIFYIPMRGDKKSFNVAIAFGIAAYALKYQPIKQKSDSH
jgi:23S rRNA (guanosine2251-2'-O)-methyltransferase